MMFKTHCSHEIMWYFHLVDAAKSLGVLEVRHLHLVRAIVEEGGPTKAAAKLHLSQSAISHQLADLERRLGVLLFVRERRRLHLTEAGKRVLALGRAVLPEFTRTELDILGGGHSRFRIRISTECFTGYHWLPRVLPQMRREFPHVDLSIDVESTRRPVAALLRGRLELAVVSTRVDDPTLHVEPLFEDEWVVIVAPSHPLAQRRYVQARDLSACTVFAHHASKQDAKRFTELLKAENTSPLDVEVVPLTEALVSLVGADLGVGLVSRWAISPHERSGTVVALRFTKNGLRERWSAVYRADARELGPLARLAQLLRAEAPVAQAL